MCKNFIFISFFVVFSIKVESQQLIQVINSGGVSAQNNSISIGEISIIPIQSQSNSGLIGILGELNQQLLTLPQQEISKGVTVFPNPTSAGIFIQSFENLQSERVFVYNELGQLILNKIINADQNIDLSSLSNGVYLIKIDKKNYNSFKIIKQ